MPRLAYQDGKPRLALLLSWTMVVSMNSVLVFVSGAADHPLAAHHLAKVEHLLDEAHVELFANPEWLHLHKAAEMQIEGSLSPAQFTHLRHALGEESIDVFMLPQQGRKKALLLADMDATIVTTETLDELADFVGLKERISGITQRAMCGELNFHMALNERVALLEGLPLSALEKTAASTQLSSGAETLVKVMRNNGATCVLVSGGFTYFTERIAQKCGFQIHHGNHLDIKDGVLTGKVLPPFLDKNAKYYFLQKYAAELGLAADETLAIGDGANDLPMLQGAGLGLGYHPKPLVYESVSNAIIHTDLTSALYVQGYTEADLKSAFVTESEPRND